MFKTLKEAKQFTAHLDAIANDVEKLEGLDELFKLAKNGPITEIGKEEKRVLEKAGFTTKEGSPPTEK